MGTARTHPGVRGPIRPLFRGQIPSRYEVPAVAARQGAPTVHEVAGSLMDAVRLDIWLDVACLFRTRSEAKRACEGGKIEVNGQHAKPNRLVREGDQIRI